MKNLLLDTNCYAAFLHGDRRVLDVLATGERVWMSAVVLGELYAGFQGGSKTLENTRLLERFLAKPTVMPLEVGQETAAIFGKVKSELKQAGTPLPINDVWIGAHALETGAVLVTYDKHFLKIAGLRTWSHL